MFVSGADNVHLKILVPSIAAGAIIGKGGETIAAVQKEAGARVKMSKANDFYPGQSHFHKQILLYNIVKSFLFVGQVILHILWKGHITNLRFQWNIYSL